jgi:hypothetical protein
MRYYKIDAIPDGSLSFYDFKKHILNEYWCLNTDGYLKVLERYKGTGVRMCGTPVSSFCVDCRNCELLYWECCRKMG